MVTHQTVGIAATGAGTRIATLVLDTGQMGWTIGIYDTFWTTTFIGISKVLGQTFASSHTVTFQTLGIGSTGIGFTRSDNLWWTNISQL